MPGPTRTALAGLLLCLVALAPWAPAAAAPLKAPAAAAPPSPTVRRMAEWVVASDDNAGHPFVIIDKVAAEVFVFGSSGRQRGAAPALLGLARGDASTPGIGDRELSAIAPEERTTPAGRFLAGFGPGPSGSGQKVLWVDFGTAISLHPVITGNPKEQRLKRLRTATPDDNRITFGCINVPAAFYQNIVRRTFRGGSGVVYILPEMRPLGEVFPAFWLAQSTEASSSPMEQALGLGEAQDAAPTKSRGTPHAGSAPRPGKPALRRR